MGIISISLEASVNNICLYSVNYKRIRGVKDETKCVGLCVGVSEILLTLLINTVHGIHSRPGTAGASSWLNQNHQKPS